ncbi:MAG: hypothetical protein DYG89_10550 [Caldilinea sp. CFX5]|nr:hypothetical protein [Caldilinea sp. CFX5]
MILDSSASSQKKTLAVGHRHMPVATEGIKRGRRNISLLLVFFLLLLPIVASAAAPQPVIGEKVQPALLTMIANQPGHAVSVIVQKTVQDNYIERNVAALGGVITKDLHILNAFAAKLPGHAVLQVAALPAVRWISLDGRVESSQKGGGGSGTTTPSNTYLDTLGVRAVWNMGRRGDGIGIAVIDSGISSSQDFNNLKKSVSFSTNSTANVDFYGHGSHVAGIIAGNGSNSGGLYAGIAPNASLYNLKIADDTGMAYESDIVEAMQWVYESKATYNIRVVNLSVNATVEQSYHNSPMSAAAEVLWFNGVVVVVSAGNKGPAGGYNTANAAPAHDPFLITVGAMDEKGTSRTRDDTPGAYSAFGVTSNGFAKPNIMAPGSKIVSVLSQHSSWDDLAPTRVVNGSYFSLSGTSMAAPMVTGAVALLLQDEPNLTPDQVKYRLLNTGSMMVDPGSGVNTPYLNVYNAVTGNTTQSANTGLTASQLLWTGTQPIAWNSVSWNSVSWNSVSWNSVSWNSVSWNSVAWNSVSWSD